MSKFIHLHTHSHYSLLKALPKISDLVKAAKKNGGTAVALTDNGNMYGAIEFYKECQKNEIKPIIGCDFYLAPRSRFDKDETQDNKRNRLVLLAKNLNGYKNLIKLVTKSNFEGFFHRPRIDFELLETLGSDLIAIIPTIASETSDALRLNNEKAAEEILKKYQKIFANNLYLEITRHEELEDHDELVHNIIDFSKKVGVPLVAAHDVFYLKPDDKRGRSIVMSIQNDGDYDRTESEDVGDYSLLSEEQMIKTFKDVPEAIENTIKIADMCNLEIVLGKWMFPDIKTASGKTHDEALREIVYAGIKTRNMEETDALKERIEYELKIIKDKGYSPYFLVVADLLRFAHENGILTTIRGSVAGSMVTYLAHITNVNPFEYKLPFERFLNPQRPSAPDIDMDYADNRRDEMIEYARQKYGRDHVAQIGTFGTMMARGAVRDVARALGYPYGVGDRIAKLIPMGSQGFPMTIERALEITPELKDMYKAESDVKEIIDMAQKIEGNARHISIHAAGVVISPIPLDELVPTQLDPKENSKVITQYDMWVIEDVGLLKFDFLGIRNLAILSDAVRLVKKEKGIDLNIEKIPLDDNKTFTMLAKGDTEGLFQLNGSGMTRYLKELKPTSILDINAMVALYRPGPMESIPQYVERKHDSSKISFLDPRLKDILSQSYGVITYQDDVLLIAINLAGYSWLEADTLRKAMGKKIPAVMEAEKEKLIKGFINFGKLSPQKAEALWKLIEPFASYGFNKAHAASYGRVAYQTSYMKANFPTEYMTAILTAESGDVEKISIIIGECKRMGIPVLPPDINKSFREFTIVKDNDKETIRFGLGSIKNFGEGIADAIINEREKNGEFADISNFLSRIKDRNLNKKSLEALIYAGALDKFAERGAMIASIEDMLSFNREHTRVNSDQSSLFGSLNSVDSGKVKLKDATPMGNDERLRMEKELLGLYVSGHPLDKFKSKLEGKTITIDRIKGMMEGMVAVVSGIVEEAKPLLTKKGDRMMFLKMADYTGSIETVIFPRTYMENKDLLIADNCIALKGKISKRNGETSLIVDAVKAL